jgi:transcriptional regulator with XRE-family HTH domain
MQVLGEQLRQRAQELDLSDAEVARRAGLTPRRYGHYVTGHREPDLQTLVRVCKVLNTTPNQLLGFSEGKPAKRRGERDRLVDRLIAAAYLLDDSRLKLAVRQVEAIIDN